MKRISMLLAIAVLACTAFAFGAEGDSAHVVLPYAARVGHETFPSGEYTISLITANSPRPILTFTGKYKSTLMVPTESVSTGADPEHAGIVITSEGDGFRLQKVIFGGRTYLVK